MPDGPQQTLEAMRPTSDSSPDSAGRNSSDLGQEDVPAGQRWRHDPQHMILVVRFLSELPDLVRLLPHRGCGQTRGHIDVVGPLT